MLRVRRLGRVRYEEADDLQRALARRSEDDYLLLLEHPHVFTLGVRADPAHILVDPATVGAAVVQTDRGGDVTYHGPGQLVLYPVVTVPDDPSAGRAHVELLQQVVIDALGDIGGGDIPGGLGRRAGYPGVWVDPEGPVPRKLASVGVRTERTGGRRRTLHGVAVNVDCDLTMFGHIVPCGIEGLVVTSLARERLPADMEAVIDAVSARAIRQWQRGPARAELDAPPWRGEGAGPPTGGARRSGADRATRGTPVQLVTGERALFRRLRQAGVDPGAGRPLADRKPEWLRVPVRIGEGYRSLRHTLHDLDLVTVCEEAGCPNIYECWADGTATFMVNGDRCTRACGFCQVDTRRPLPLDAGEPERVAEAVERMGLRHAVVTCVARDDLADGGAGAIARTVRAIRARGRGTAVEVLISDCRGDRAAQEEIFAARPDVLNHNIETVARLQRAVRPSAGYARSLTVLARAADAGLVTKSGLMVGLGETRDEVVATLADLASVGVSIATIGQYLRPSREHLPVSRWWTPAAFDELAEEGRRLGLAHVESSPLTRSSYHAREAAAGSARERAGAALSTPDQPALR